MFLLAIGDHHFIDEFATVVGINPQDRKWEQRPRSLEGSQYHFLTPIQKGKTFRSSSGYIGERQGVQVPSLNVCTTMGAPGPLPESQVGSHATLRTSGWESAA